MMKWQLDCDIYEVRREDRHSLSLCFALCREAVLYLESYWEERVNCWHSMILAMFTLMISYLVLIVAEKSQTLLVRGTLGNEEHEDS